jgi:O-acetyl-ADP-ribose deacetylase (regulator of RNase III)
MEGVTWLVESRFGVKVGDITSEKVDAIVNAANSSLMGGGGVDGAIHRKGGPAILEACRAIRKESYPDGLPTGQAVVTVAGSLPCRHVIHTVGPVWHGGDSGEPDLLRSAYLESLSQAEKIGARQIVFPAISTGVYGYPKDRAAALAYQTIKSHLDSHTLPEKVFLIFFSQQDADLFLGSYLTAD